LEIRLARLCAQSIKLPRRVSDARVFYPETASRSREKFEPPNFTRDAKLPSGHFPFSFEPKPLALRRVLNHHAIRSATASLCQNATRVVSVPTHGPGRRLSIATPVPRHESELNGTAAVRHIAPFAERVSTRTHDASAGGARQRRRQSETSVSRFALARFSRRDRPGPGSGARDEAPRTRSNAPTVCSSRPPTKFTR
jgi:hypothetical protein